MLELTAALIGCAFCATTDAGFADIWYSEVMDGDFAAAAERYERLYLSPPFEGPGQEVRARAAFRAGLCFERTRELDRARGAYEWIVNRAGGLEAIDAATSAHATDSLVVQALRRLQKLPASASKRLPPVDVTVREAMESVAEAQRRRVRRLSDHAARLRDLLERRGRSRDRIEELLAGFRERGCPLRFRDEDLLVEPPQDGALRLLEQLFRVDDDQERELHSQLALTFSLRGLRACLVSDLAAVRRDLYTSAVLLHDERVDALRTRFHAVSRAVPREEDTRTIGERLLVDALAAERLRVRQAIEDTLRSADRYVRVGRAHRAIPELAAVFDDLEWLLPEIRENRQIAQLEDRAQRELLRLGREAVPEAVLADLWTQRRRLARDVVSLAVRAVDLAYAQTRAQSPAVTETPAAAEEHALRELRRQLSAARAPASAPDAESALEKARFLLSWFPGLDRQGLLRAELASIAEALSASPTERRRTQ